MTTTTIDPTLETLTHCTSCRGRFLAGDECEERQPGATVCRGCHNHLTAVDCDPRFGSAVRTNESHDPADWTWC